MRSAKNRKCPRHNVVTSTVRARGTWAVACLKIIGMDKNFTGSDFHSRSEWTLTLSSQTTILGRISSRKPHPSVNSVFTTHRTRFCDSDKSRKIRRRFSVPSKARRNQATSFQIDIVSRRVRKLSSRLSSDCSHSERPGLLLGHTAERQTGDPLKPTFPSTMVYTVYHFT
jgi:hypothetical protein